MKDDGLWLETLSILSCCGISMWLHVDWMAAMGICWELWRCGVVIFWSGMDQILTDGNHQWMQMASMTMRLLTALGFTMAVRCCRVSDRWESLMGCWQWYWVFCLTGLTSKGGMEGYKPG